MKKNIHLLFIFLISLLLNSCSDPSTVQNQETAVDEIEMAADIVPEETSITIDGDPSDWEKYEVLFTDQEGDHSGGEFDIAAIRAFRNDTFLYVLVETYKPPRDYIQVDMEIATDAKRYIFSFKPQDNSVANMGEVTNSEFVHIGEIARSRSSADRAVEMKIPLSVFVDLSFLTLSVRPMSGECCEYPQWFSVDETEMVAPQLVDETEPKQDLTVPAYSPGEILVIEQTQVDLSKLRGDEPTDLVMTKDGKRIYTLGRNTDSVFVIDGTTNQITDVISIQGINNNAYGARPDKLALSPDEAFLLTANYNDSSVSILDTASLTVVQTAIVMPEPCDIAVSTNSYVYAVSGSQPKIARFTLDDPTSVEFSNLSAPAFAVAVSPDGTRIYTASSQGISVLSAETMQRIQQITLPVQGYGGNILLNKEGSTAFVSMRDTNKVFQIDLASGSVVHSYDVSAAAEGLALNHEEDLLFVGTFTALMMFDYTVAVIDLNTQTIAHTIMPLSPAMHVSWVPVVEGLAINPEGQAYIAGEDGDAIFITDAETFKHIATIPLTAYAQLQPVRLSINTDGNWLLTANAAPQSASISLISTADQNVNTYFYDEVENAACLSGASGATFSPLDNSIYVSAGKCLLIFDASQRSFINEKLISLPENAYLTDLRIHPNGETIYLLDNEGGLTKFDLETMTAIERLQATDTGYNLKVSEEGDRIYITGGSDFAVVDLEYFELLTLQNASFTENKQFGSYTMRLIGIHPSEPFFLIGDFFSFSFFDKNDFKRIRSIDLDPWAPHHQLATDAIFSPDGNTGYLALWDMKGVVAFDAFTREVTAQIDTGSAPWYVVCPDDFAISPDGSRIYVTGEQSDNILIIDTETNQPVDVINLLP